MSEQSIDRLVLSGLIPFMRQMRSMLLMLRASHVTAYAVSVGRITSSPASSRAAIFVELAVGNVTVPDFYSFHTVRDVAPDLKGCGAVSLCAKLIKRTEKINFSPKFIYTVLFLVNFAFTFYNLTT